MGQDQVLAVWMDDPMSTAVFVREPDGRWSFITFTSLQIEETRAVMKNNHLPYLEDAQIELVNKVGDHLQRIFNMTSGHLTAEFKVTGDGSAPHPLTPESAKMLAERGGGKLVTGL